MKQQKVCVQGRCNLHVTLTLSSLQDEFEQEEEIFTNLPNVIQLIALPRWPA